MWRLDGKNALITGATKGIGLAAAQVFAELGADVSICARNPEALKEAVLSFQDRGLKLTAVQADISRQEGRQTLFKEISGRYDDLHILLSNAGMNIRKKTLEYSQDEIDTVLNTNLTAAYELSRLFHPLMMKRPGASIIYMVSVAGLTHLRTGTPYAMSKAALIQLTRNLACEWAPDGIRVNAVAPWYIETPMVKELLKDQAYRENILDRTPMKRVGRAEEAANAAAFLAMDEASYITGQCLAVDGGFSVYGF